MRTTETFQNEPFTDFSDEANAKKQREALVYVESQLGKEYPLVIGGKEVTSGSTFESVNPADHSQVIGRFQNGTLEDAQETIRSGNEKFKTWRYSSPEERADIAFKAADIMRRRRFEVNAWMILEAGKSWPEADGDTAEAIDFLDFYGREALRYGGKQPITPLEHENNEMFYVPLGVGAIIPPWNFPMAIPCGMASAAWVTGNTVILKPASTTPAVAWIMCEIFKEAGLPPGVVSFLSGPGSVVGNAIVESPHTRFIAFTGSQEVGLGITEKAGMRIDGHRWIKRIVAEMGGKNAIIIDSEANLDEAAQAVVASAYGYQGQKCSACSRAIVDEAVHDEFVTKVVALTKEIKLGNPTDQNHFMGPVNNKTAYRDIMAYIETGKKEGSLLCGGGGDDSKGWFIEPTIIDDVKPDARIAQEEIFGPVLAIIKAKNFDNALDIANGTAFGLTGAIFSKNQAKLERARREFFVGNLYINRKCTGALVGSQPFGGFNMSGTDSKAGGRDYLLLFLQAKTVSEKK